MLTAAPLGNSFVFVDILMVLSVRLSYFTSASDYSTKVPFLLFVAVMCAALIYFYQFIFDFEYQAILFVNSDVPPAGLVAFQRFRLAYAVIVKENVKNIKCYL